MHPEERDWVNVREIIDEAMSDVRYLTVGKAVSVDLAGDFPDVFCHRVLMSSVFTNLLSNAIKYSKKQGEIQIEISYSDKYYS